MVPFVNLEMDFKRGLLNLPRNSLKAFKSKTMLRFRANEKLLSAAKLRLNFGKKRINWLDNVFKQKLSFSKICHFLREFLFLNFFEIFLSFLDCIRTHRRRREI